jgi:hypothetical protein
MNNLKSYLFTIINRFMKHSDVWYGSVAVTFAMLLSSSCTDDSISGKIERGDNSIRFSSWISANSQKSANSRAENPNSLYESFDARKIPNSNMYLITTVEDGISTAKVMGEDADAASRGTLVNAGNVTEAYSNMYKHLELQAYAYDTDLKLGSGSDAYGPYDAKSTPTQFAGVAADVQPFISGELMSVTKGDNNELKITPSRTYYWTFDSKRTTFFGIMPALSDMASNYNNTYSYNYTTKRPTITYQMHNASDVRKQYDLMCAVANCSGTGTAENYTVSLEMKHILCAVGLELGDGFDSDNYISSVLIQNVRTKGDYDIASDTWTLDDSTLGEVRIQGNTGTDESTTATTSDNNLLMMFPPQTISKIGDSDVHMEVWVGKKGSTEKEVFYPDLTGVVLPEGKTVTMVISNTDKKTDYFFTSEFDTMYFSWDGTPAGNGDSYSETVKVTNSDGSTSDVTQQISDLGATRVKSYKAVTDKNGTTFENVAWTAEVKSGSISTYPKKSEEATALSEDNVDASDYVTYSSADEDYKFKSVTKYNYKFTLNIGTESPTTIPSEDTQKLNDNKNYIIGNSNNYYDLSYYKQEIASATQNSDGTYTCVPKRYTNDAGKESRYTANCYMIRYPGYYEIPVVYGNGLYDDSENSGKAFKLSTQGETFAVGHLLDYKDNTISYKGTNPWIEYHNGHDYYSFPANNGDSKRATKDTYIIWQDSKNLVQIDQATLQKNWTTSSSEYYITFYISPDNFKPGNAVIAVKNPESPAKILWSYHIWVTPYTNHDTFTADANIKGGNNSITYLKVPLGFVQEDYLHYAKRESVLLLKQANSGIEREIKLIQKEHTCARHSCTYYQWGRKDPFPGAIMLEHGHLYYDDRYKVDYTPKTIYDDNGAETTMALGKNVKTTLGSGIQNPGTYYVASQYSDGGWSNRFPDDGSSKFNYWDLWGCTVNDKGVSDPAAGNLPGAAYGTSSCKTVYDPCPQEFKVPPVYYFPAVTYNGENLSSVISPWSRTATAESELYGNKVNTPFTSHDDFINTGGFVFYKNRMNGEGDKAKGDTYTLYAMGEISNSGSYYGIGTECYYWTCTSWAAAWSAVYGIYNHRNYYFHVGYTSTSTFEPVTGNTESFGCAILPVKGN